MKNQGLKPMPSKARKKLIFGTIFASPKPRFFEILAIKMKIIFCNENQEKIKRPENTFSPPRAKAQWPVASGFGSVGEEEALSKTPVGLWPGELLQKKTKVWGQCRRIFECVPQCVTSTLLSNNNS